MRRFAFVSVQVILTVTVLLSLWLFMTSSGSEYLDGRRFAELDRRCEAAREIVHRRIDVDTIDIEDHPWADVVNESYAPHFILVQLMVEPKVVEVANVRFESKDESNAACRGSFVSVVRGLDSMPKSMLCGERIRGADVPRAPVLVRLEHGLQEGDIRPFKLLLIESGTNTVLAEQSSYELLLGHMRSTKNRAWYGMGGAQVSRACKLTKPRDFIASVLRASSYQAPGAVSSNPSFEPTSPGVPGSAAQLKR